ncbi:MAG: RtcB family protein [Acidimicrobiales bacterium]
MPTTPADNLLTWADDLDGTTLDQVANAAALPFVHHPVALMADAHLGYGVPIGTVLATKGAVIPSAVGVDIGCGMAAQRLSVSVDELDLDRLHDRISQVVPAGQPTRKATGSGSFRDTERIIDLSTDDEALLSAGAGHTGFDVRRAADQFGTLGGGNHFVEVCEDTDGAAWIVLHSGSRGVGNTIAKTHIDAAKGLMAAYFIELGDPDLAYLVEGTPEFTAYITAMLWAQDYAARSRSLMMRATLAVVAEQSGGPAAAEDEINCHHNYTTREHHHGQNLWVTRKGAIDAGTGKLGIIPGSMATGSYIVEGCGSPASYCSASHGAGRTMSRSAARKQLTEASLDDRMDGIAWNHDAGALLDEHPDAYKRIEDVMANQSDLVRPVARLRTVLNYKGA